MGYFFLLEEHVKSTGPVRFQEPHFRIREEFIDSSYLKRYGIFCEKLLRERLYDAAAFIVSNKNNGAKGEYAEPGEYLSIKNFIKSITERIHTVYS
ncbi:MAG: hypothetical protein JXD23_05685 [Spirochaetales bacterium]|nr:hypothetical protein [Spirochaetales bacterium]